MLLIFIFVAAFGSVALLAYALIPVFRARYETIQEHKAARASSLLADMFIWIGQNKLIVFYVLSPLVFAGLFFLFLHKIFMLFVGVAIGFMIPSLVLRTMEKHRKKKFHYQLIDALLNIGQSLKAGLSFLQSLEVMVEEMPPPISQEFALILKENKMGKSMEESFERLNKKMDIEDLNMMTTAILVARETGGNLAQVFSHLADTIRQKHRIVNQVKTLTTQARWQSVILSFLPIIFAIFIYRINPDYFTVMINDNIGRLLLIWCVISWILGAYLLNRLGKIDV